jgi:hypothetical protein
MVTQSLRIPRISVKSARTALSPKKIPGASSEVANWLAARSDLVNCVFLAAIPIAMSIVNCSWLYSPVGYLDPWINVGYFLHYADPTFGLVSYKTARLSWIIPGFVAYQIFKPIVANYILHMGCLLASIIFFYLTVARLFGPLIAFATSACFAVFVPFHGSAGWDYQNAAAGAYYFLSFYLLTTALLSNNMRLRLIGAGAAYAATVHATISFINMAPLLVAHFLVLYRCQFGKMPTWRSILWAGGSFLSAAVFLTALLGLINVAVGRDFLFFKPLVELVINFVGDNRRQAPWWLPWSAKWYLQSYYVYFLSFVFSVFAGSIGSAMFAIVRGRINPIALTLQAGCLFVVILWIVWQSLGQTALQPEFFAYPLFPVTFFGLAGIAATRRAAKISRPPSVLYNALLASVVAVPLVIPLIRWWNLLEWAGHHVEMALSALALLFVIAFALSGSRAVLVALAVVAFSIWNGLGASAAGLNWVYAISEPCKDRAGGLRALIDSEAFLTRFASKTSDMFVWWDRNEMLDDQKGCTLPLSYFAASTVSLGFNYLAPPWPQMPSVNELPQISPSLVKEWTRIAILTNDRSNVNRMIDHYAQGGVKLAVEGRTVIRTSRFSFSLFVISPDPRVQTYRP